MVHLLQVSVVLTTIALVALVVLIYTQYDNATNNVTEVIEIISNQTGLSAGSGGAIVSTGNETGPNDITLPSNVQILQNEINDTRYTAILFTENLTQS